jgi:hypothetical protein
MSEIKDRISNYLLSGGLFNPELMEHAKVSELIVDCREYIKELEEKLAEAQVALKALRTNPDYVEELEDKLSIAIEAIKFYAYEAWVTNFENEKFADIVTIVDCERLPEKDNVKTGGKRAREALEKITK